ncbi:MAG: class II fructose-bisphosphate aldolase [Patescibacteria group bacterium]
MLVHIKKLLDYANRRHCAIGAFNVNNLEILQAVLRGAEKMKSPVIIQTSPSAIKYAGLKELSSLIRVSADNVKIPVALHLDHGHDFELARDCINAGYSSVMIDGSTLPFEQNIALTKKVVNYAHAKEVFVQGELGRLEGSEDWLKSEDSEAFLTEPQEAVDFVFATGVDTLAVAIGNYHGVEKLTEHKILKLDFARLKEIKKQVKVPLVLHGASGFKFISIKKAIYYGIRIINIDSELRYSFALAEKAFWAKNKNIFDPREILAPATRQMQKTVERKIRNFGSGSFKL